MIDRDAARGELILEMFAYRVKNCAAAYLAALVRVDAVPFTAE